MAQSLLMWNVWTLIRLIGKIVDYSRLLSGNWSGGTEENRIRQDNRCDLRLELCTTVLQITTIIIKTAYWVFRKQSIFMLGTEEPHR